MKTGTSKSFLVRAAMLLLGVLTMTTAMADRQPPVYNIEVCKGGIGEVYIRGWAYDPPLKLRLKTTLIMIGFRLRIIRKL